MKRLWQSIQAELRIISDGIPGPATAGAVARSLGLRRSRRKPVNQTSFPLESPDQSELFEYYGEPGLHQVSLELPYSMVLSWDQWKVVKRFSCHEKIHDALKRVFARTLDQYGLNRIRELQLDQFGGCLNVRKKRGGKNWSLHAWGAAVDLDPNRNSLKWDHTKAAFARDEYKPFWEIVEAEGFTSLGRERDFDWMHFQAARVP